MRVEAGSGREGAKMCGGGRAGGIQFISFARRWSSDKWARANDSPWQDPEFIPCNMCVISAGVSFGVDGVAGVVWFHLVLLPI